MKRFPIVLAATLSMTAAASASANFGCVNAGGGAAQFSFEAVTSRDGKYLDSILAELELSSGTKISFEKPDVKSNNWGKNFALVLSKRTPDGVVQVNVYAKPQANDESLYDGTFVATIAGKKLQGKLECSGG